MVDWTYRRGLDHHPVGDACGEATGSADGAEDWLTTPCVGVYSWRWRLDGTTLFGLGNFIFRGSGGYYADHSEFWFSICSSSKFTSALRLQAFSSCFVMAKSDGGDGEAYQPESGDNEEIFAFDDDQDGQDWVESDEDDCDYGEGYDHFVAYSRPGGRGCGRQGGGRGRGRCGHAPSRPFRGAPTHSRFF